MSPSRSISPRRSAIARMVVGFAAPLAVCAMLAPTAAGQQRPEPARAAQQMKARNQIALMERALEMAVLQGAKMVQQQLPSSVPQMLLFTGPARARGHRLDGYGVFFDVEVPALSQSVMWSFQTLERDLGLNQALQVIRDAAEQVTDRSTKINLQQAVQRIELQMAPAGSYPAPEAAPPPPAAANAGTARQVSDRTAVAPAPQPRVLAEQAPRLSPDAIYESEVKNALIEAMLNNTASIVLAPDEWLTVAARDSGDRLSANEIYDFVTIQLRIRGSDLAAFRSDRLSEDDAKKRVEVRVF